MTSGMKVEIINSLRDSRIVQLETTHFWSTAVYRASLHRHAWSVVSQDDWDTEVIIQSSFEGLVL